MMAGLLSLWVLASVEPSLVQLWHLITDASAKERSMENFESGLQFKKRAQAALWRTETVLW